jgi:CRISPR-associated protein Cmr1
MREVNQMRRELVATYKLTTPLFMAGADQTNAELRAPSIKGALRFWYRAVALSRPGGWQEVKEEEWEIFGSSKTGQGQFLITVDGNGLPKPETFDFKRDRAGIVYLGYGLKDAARKYFKHGPDITVRLLFKPDSGETVIEPVKKALIALGLFGGLGARARNGLGSVAITSLRLDGVEEWKCPQDEKELQEKIGEFIKSLAPLPVELPAYTAFSAQSRIVVAETGRDPVKLLDGIGRTMMAYRRDIKDDSALIRKFLNHVDKSAHPRRVAFGLPHNYFFKSDKAKVDVKAVRKERRAGPLFIHVHALAGERYAVVLTLLPAVFLPGDEEIKLSGFGRDKTVPCRVDYGVIEQFMQEFSNRLEVIP